MNNKTLQYRIERYVAKKVKELTLETYLFYCMFFFFIAGLGLTLYVLLARISFGNLHIFSDPLFYLGLGLCLCIAYLLVRRSGYGI